MHVLGLSRRRLLGGSAAAALSYLPFSKALLPSAKAQAAGPNVLVLLYHPFGVVEENFYPSGGATLTTFPSGSAPLAEIKSDVIMFRNLDNLAGERAKCEAGHDQHVAGVQTIWTGGPLKGGPGGALRSLPTMPSVDWVVGEHLRAKHGTKLAALNLGVRCLATDIGYTTVDSAGQVKRQDNNPSAAYTTLFGDGKTPPPVAVSPEEAARRLAAKRSMLDDVVKELGRFEASLAGPERETFQAHVSAMRTFETKVAQHVETMAPQMGCQNLPDAARFQAVFNSDEVWKTADVQAQLLVLALSCGRTNVASLNITSGFGARYVVPKAVFQAGPAGSVDPHDLSHDVYAGSKEIKTNRDNTNAKSFVNLVKLLKATASPRGGTLFDEAIVLWSSCISGRHGGGHTRVKIPFVVGAGKKSGFVPGRIIDAGGRGQNQILLSTCQAFGMNLTSFGSKDLCPGPMSALTSPGAMPAFARPAIRGFACQGA